MTEEIGQVGPILLAYHERPRGKDGVCPILGSSGPVDVDRHGA